MGVRDVDAATAKNRAALRGTGLLFTSALVWGCAFVPQAISVENMSAWWASGLRFALAAPIALVLAGRRLRAPGVTVASAVVLGVIFAIAFWLQTEAVRTAPVARVALITGTYAVFTPLFAPLFGLRRPTVLHWGGAGVAFWAWAFSSGSSAGAMRSLPRSGAAMCTRSCTRCSPPCTSCSSGGWPRAPTPSPSTRCSSR